jgi:hypothetical protein
MAKSVVLKRKAQKTLLFVGEGSTEKAFLDYLKELYHLRWSGVIIKTRSAEGGSPEGIIRKAIKWVQFEQYDDGCVLLDSDIPVPDSLLKKALSKRIRLFMPTPCIEGLFLKILGDFDRIIQDTPTCKSEFHRKYLTEDEATDKENYKRIFTKSVLDNNRKITLLDNLIRIFESSTPKA